MSVHRSPAGGVDADVLVVGAGPAGAAAAIKLRQLDPSLTVLLADRADFPRDKVCGDGLGPDAVVELAQLGAASVLDGYQPVLRLALKGPGATVEGASPAVGFVVPRFVFDARLVRRATEAGAELVRMRVRSLSGAGAGVVSVNGGELRVRHVIGADGAHSAVRRCIPVAPMAPAHTAVAIRGYTGSPEAEAFDTLTLIWPGGGWGRAYAWAFPVGDGTVNVGAGVFAAGSATRSDLERLAAEALPPGLAADPDTVRGHLLPLTSQGPVYGAGRVLLVGDAAGLVNPLSGEGIFYALASGSLAAEAVVAHPAAPLELYSRSMRRRFSRHFATTRLFAMAADRPALLRRAIRTAAKDRDFFTSLADVALGDGSFDLRSAAAFAAEPFHSKRRRP